MCFSLLQDNVLFCALASCTGGWSGCGRDEGGAGLRAKLMANELADGPFIDSNIFLEELIHFCVADAQLCASSIRE